MITIKYKFCSRFSHISILSALIFLTISCQKEVELNIETNANRLLVNAEFTNEMDIHTVELLRPAGILNSNPAVPVSHARVIITDGVDTIHFAESTDPGIYNTLNACAGIPTKTYTLIINNIDIDNDGKNDEFTARCKMPEPVLMDSLRSERGLHPSDKTKGINNYCSFRITSQGPDYILRYVEVGSKAIRPLSEWLGSGDIGRFESEFKTVKPDAAGVFKNSGAYYQIPENDTIIQEGALITFVCLNLTAEHFTFLKEFDNNSSYDWLDDNLYDQIKMPKNLPTNLVPSNKAAGYFNVYSISRISKKLEN